LSITRSSRAACIDQHVEHVAIGSSHTVALSSTGQLYSWGWGERGQLGQGLPGSFHASLATGHDPRDTRRYVAGGDRTTESTRARKLQLAYDVSFKPPASFKGGNSIRVVSVACGDNHTIVLTSNRVVFTWGVGDSGQLGHASTANEWAPRQLLSLNGRGVCRVRAAHAMLGGMSAWRQLLTLGVNDAGGSRSGLQLCGHDPWVGAVVGHGCHAWPRRREGADRYRIHACCTQ